jgi:hypothetical protein
LQISPKAVSLHCVFHSIRFKVNKGWSKALLLFLCPDVYFPPQRMKHSQPVVTFGNRLAIYFFVIFVCFFIELPYICHIRIPLKYIIMKKILFFLSWIIYIPAVVFAQNTVDINYKQIEKYIKKTSYRFRDPIRHFQNKKQTAWKTTSFRQSQRRGRMRMKLKDNILRRLHSLQHPSPIRYRAIFHFNSRIIKQCVI